jgi:hypothetical protein
MAVRELSTYGSTQTDHHCRSFYPQSIVSALQQQYHISLRHVCSSATVVLHNSIMSAPSTTSYVPFDSEAPAVFKNTQMNNYVKGEWLNQSHDIDIISRFLTH